MRRGYGWESRGASITRLTAKRPNAQPITTSAPCVHLPVPRRRRAPLDAQIRCIPTTEAYLCGGDCTDTPLLPGCVELDVLFRVNDPIPEKKRREE